LPDPSFAKIVVLTDDEEARETLKSELRQAVADGWRPRLACGSRRSVFGPPSPFPVAFRVMGPTRTSCVTLRRRRCRDARQPAHENDQQRLGPARAVASIYARSGQAPEYRF
jgi:hypothetical protein